MREVYKDFKPGNQVIFISLIAGSHHVTASPKPSIRQAKTRPPHHFPLCRLNTTTAPITDKTNKLPNQAKLNQA